VNEPRTRLHDVSVEGDLGDRDALLAAIEGAVAAATRDGAPSTQDVEAAITAQVVASRQS
jgi:hypothetical protein